MVAGLFAVIYTNPMKFLWPSGGKHNFYGTLAAPNMKGIPVEIVNGGLWAADIGCLDGPSYVKRLDWNSLFDWLQLMRPYVDKCLFIAGGDVVANAFDTYTAYEELGHYFSGFPVAYVAQNGAEDLTIPISCAAVFVGGDTEWKLSSQAVDVIKRAQNLGKHVHIGRVNWYRRYKAFEVLSGSDRFTCDGTRIRYGRDKAVQDWKAYERQKPLITI